MKKSIRLPAGVLLAAIAVAGCGGLPGSPLPADTPPPEEIPLVADDGGVVAAEAIVEPALWTEMRAPSPGGQVATVAVREGDAVSEGEVLLVLDTGDAELAVKQAAATRALAQAQLAGVKAGARPEEIAVSEARLAVARAAVAEAEARRDRLNGGEAWSDIVAAEAALAAAVAEEKQAFYAHEQTMDCFSFKWGGKKHTICPALGRIEESARSAWSTSQDGVDAAEAFLTAARNQATARARDVEAAVAAGVAHEAGLQANLDLQRAGSQPERIAAAEAEVGRARASLEQAMDALEELSIRAPFDATAAEVTVEAGDTVSPGQVVVVLATLDQLQVRTTDLLELDVVRVEAGQPVTVTFDALPDAPLLANVARIADQPHRHLGDVTYPVIIEPNRSLEELRWGMTALVEIDVE